jgi:hypothetical protein
LLGLVGACQVCGHTADAQPRVLGQQVEQHWELFPHNPLPVHAGVELQMDVEFTGGLADEVANHLHLFRTDQQRRELVRQQEGDVGGRERSDQENRARNPTRP